MSGISLFTYSKLSGWKQNLLTFDYLKVQTNSKNLATNKSLKMSDTKVENLIFFY